MAEPAKNTFAEGLVLGVDSSLQKNTTLAGGSNVRLFTRDNNSFIATNYKGMDIAAHLPPGFVLMAAKSYNGIAYIVSAEVINGQATGVGEVGTFPSPRYTDGNSGTIHNQYSSIKNYAGDNNEFPQKNGGFRSSEFKFSLDKPVSMELQPDYDGTVNIIINDGKNPIRIINSGFTSLPGNKYEIIDRTGTADTNRYSKDNFSNIINLISRSSKIMRVSFEGVEAGGSLKGGNYQYYFKYATMDGDETEVVAQSFSVSVFHGNTIATIRGSKGEGENTDKRVRFVLSNLDQAYRYVRVYMVFTAGSVEEIKSAFRINANYQINGDSLEFIHTGFEELEQIDIAELSVDYSPIETAQDITQADGYLIAANIKEKDFNRSVFDEFAKKVKLGHKEQKLDVITYGQRMYNEILSGEIKSGTDGYNGAYHNPFNVYHKIGYHGGEAYPFGFSFVFNDGSLSRVFPAIGIDDIRDEDPYTLNFISNTMYTQMANNDGFLPGSAKMINTKGIYRFPNRDVSGVDNMFANGRVSIFGVTFKIPNFNEPEYEQIRENAIGIVFMRAERKPDKITQGYIINTVPVPNVRHIQSDSEFYKLWNYMESEGGYNDDNCMFIPAFDYMLESARWYDSRPGSGSRDAGSGEEAIHPIRLNTNRRTLHKDKKFALISSDVILNKQKYLQLLNGRDIRVTALKSIRSRYSVPTYQLNRPSSPDYFSLIDTETFLGGIPKGNITGKSSWVEGHNELRNGDLFSGAAFFQALVTNPGNNHYGMFPLSYNDYVGITLDSTYGFGTPSFEGEAGEEIRSALINTTAIGAILVNIYPSTGQRTADAVKAIYSNIDNFVYTPISERMTWSELEDKLDSERKITLFNGDCFIDVGYRRIYQNMAKKQEDDDDLVKQSQANIGYTISFVNESDHNIAFRGTELFDINEEKERSFAPNYTEWGTIGDKLGEGNTWRVLRQPESSEYNKGYSKVFQDKQHIALPQEAPYLGSRYFSRIMWSAKHIPNSFENGYRLWTGLNFQDYPTKFGEIVGVRGIGGFLVVIFEHGVGILGVNERVQTGSDSSGPVFIESSGVLSPHISMKSEKYGTRFKSSIFVTDNTVGAVDADQSVIWRVAGDQLEDLSKFTIEPYLTRYMKSFKGRRSKILDCDIVSSWDVANRTVFFSFYRMGGTEKENVTFPYNEDGRFFEPTFDGLAYASFNINGELFSLNTKDSNRTIWKHNSDNDGSPRQYIYGEMKPCKIRFIVNIGYDVSKIFDNLQLVSNNVLPDKIRYYVQGAYSEQVIVYDKQKIYLSNAKYRNEKVVVSIPSVKVITDRDPTEYFPSEIDNAEAIIQPGSRFKGKAMVVELEYNTVKQLRLSSALTFFR